MKQTFTLQFFILHAYGETTPEQKEAFVQELSENTAANNEYMNIMRVKRMLNSKMKSPSPTSVRIIMEYSGKTEHFVKWVKG